MIKSNTLLVSIVLYGLVSCRDEVNNRSNEQVPQAQSKTEHIDDPTSDTQYVPADTTETRIVHPAKEISRPISITILGTDCGELEVIKYHEEKRKQNTIRQSIFREEDSMLIFEQLIDDPGREDIGCSNNRSQIIFRIASGKDEHSLSAVDLNQWGCNASTLGGNLMSEGNLVSAAQLEMKRLSDGNWLVAGYIDVMMEDIHAGGKTARRFILKETFTKK